ncbi:MAG: hypothetical protein O3B09_01675, partial [Proteobacteria bacterium]|nr:hypothetical protein [Pseudomonadota bacterium]
MEGRSNQEQMQAANIAIKEEKNPAVGSVTANNITNQEISESDIFWKKLFIFPFFNFANLFRKKSKQSLLKSVNRIIDSSEVHGLIASEEKKMIKNIINIGGVKVKDI